MEMSTLYFPIHLDFSNKPTLFHCLQISFEYYRYLLVFIFTIEQINTDAVIFSNITLGYQIYGFCDNVRAPILSTLKILSGAEDAIPNYSCWKDGVLVGFIQSSSSSSSRSIAQILGIYRYPQISYGSTDMAFNNRITFPSFYRTAPNEILEVNVFVELLKRFGSKWVGVIVSDDDAGYRASEELKNSISTIGGCVAFVNVITYDFFEIQKVILQINQTTAFVIVVFLSTEYIGKFAYIFSTQIFPQKLWVMSSFFIKIADYRFENMKHTLNGTLTVAVHQEQIPGFMEFLYNANPSTYPDDYLLADIWESLFPCILSNHSVSPSVTAKCTGKESLQDIDLSYFGAFDFRITYRVYIAVYALAYALQDMYEKGRYNIAQNTFHQWQFNTFVRNVHFTTASKYEMYFDSKGDPPARFDIIKWILFENETFVNYEVGTYDQSAPMGRQLQLLKSTNLWSPYISEKPFPVCGKSCLPGYRIAKREGEPPCCYDCVRCSDGEISNTTDAGSCLKCPEDQWSNEKRNHCIPRCIEFLSFDEPLGCLLTVIALILSLISALVLVIFIKYWDTPIVKANNRYISCILLVSIKLSFLCTLLFIGRPSQMTCLIRQSVFGVVFAVAVSCVLAKTITVVIAFKATNPNSRLKNWIGIRVSTRLVLVCSLGEIVICSVWMLRFTPFPDTDTQSEAGKIILQCNEGSTYLFFCAIGYIFILALLSFLIAFLAKDFPDSYNEAKNITFCMLLFCSVWISFIPAYLSTKGRKTVAFEIFAILVSGAGLLVCIFIPKCYIIFIRPDQNTHHTILRKRYVIRKN